MKRIIILGGGFAGLWSAVGAARRLDELGIPSSEIEILLVDRTDWHAIRVRNYERNLADVRVRFDDVLSPIGVRRLRGEVLDIDLDNRCITVGGLSEPIGYDRLVFALGSRLDRPPLPGLAEHAFDVDTYEGAVRLQDHLAALLSRPASCSRSTVLIIGAGLTGIEVATEMPDRLAALGNGHVILADRAPWIGSDMGQEARNVIEEALTSLQVEARAGSTLLSVDSEAALLATGEQINAATIVWCGGMRAPPLCGSFPVLHDRFGRLPVDECLKVKGLRAEFAAGDSACLLIDGSHTSVMSCQHARPMGRFAGYNVVCDLLGEPLLPLQIDWYVTVLDLGRWGAVYTEGWNRHVVLKGRKAKRVKQTINCQRIYPPRTGEPKSDSRGSSSDYPSPAGNDALTMVMREYNLPHVLKSEQQHFALMSSLLDPMERAHIVRMGMGPGSRCGSRLLRRIVNPLVPGKIAIALTTPQHPSRGRFVGNTEMIGKLKNWHVGNAAG